MTTSVKQSIKSIVRLFLTSCNGTRLGNFISKQILSVVMEEMRTISHNGVSMHFAAPNSLCDWRARTFSSKEPETLEWINEMPDGSIVWDIGANIGLYSVYAAKKRNCKVWAFEPSVFNLELLARNIYVNELTNQICIIPLALNDKLGISEMKMTTTEWGGAMSTFDQDFGWDGNTIQQVFTYKTLGISMEEAIIKLSIPQPDYIKIDVDGLEHIILSGGLNVLSKIKGILIEVNDGFHEQANQCHHLLTEAGLVIKEKRHSDFMASSTTGFQYTFNQIWIRPQSAK